MIARETIPPCDGMRGKGGDLLGRLRLYPSDKRRESHSHLESDLFKLLNVKQKLNGNLKERRSEHHVATEFS